jgi:hypothetical protein
MNKVGYRRLLASGSRAMLQSTTSKRYQDINIANQPFQQHFMQQTRARLHIPKKKNNQLSSSANKLASQASQL